MCYRRRTVGPRRHQRLPVIHALYISAIITKRPSGMPTLIDSKSKNANDDLRCWIKEGFANIEPACFRGASHPLGRKSSFSLRRVETESRRGIPDLRPGRCSVLGARLDMSIRVSRALRRGGPAVQIASHVAGRTVWSHGVVKDKRRRRSVGPGRHLIGRGRGSRRDGHIIGTLAQAAK